MDVMQTMVQTAIVIDGSSSLLAQDQDIDDLRQRIEAATASTGRFVDFVVVGNRTLSVLITARSRVMISTSTVHFDPRDTGDVAAPFGGLFDF